MSAQPNQFFAKAVRWFWAAMLGRLQLPGWLALAVAIFLGVPAWSESVRFWLETAKTTGGWGSNLGADNYQPVFPRRSRFIRIWIFSSRWLFWY